MNKHQRKDVSFPHSLRFKFIISYIVIISVLLVLLNTYPMLATQNLIFRNKQSTLESQTSVMASYLSELQELQADGVAQVMSALNDDGLTRVLVTDDSGLILYDTATDEASVTRYALFAEVTQALAGNVVFQSAYQDGAFRSGAASPVVYRNVIIGAVYVYEYDVEQAEMLQGLQDNLWKLSVLFFAIAVLFSIFLSHRMTSGISRLLSGIAVLREGEYQYRADLRGKDELALLAEEFNELAERLEQTDEVRRRFVSDASHELKTPLASIRLLTDSILQSDQIDMATTKEFVADIGDEAQRLSRITEALLVLTRLDDGQEVPSAVLDVRDSVRDAAHLLEPVARERDVTIQLHLEERCPVRSNEDDLYQILFNLMENAVKYNLPGGSVTVSAWQAEGKVQLRVEDTGIGIPEADRDKVFDRFFRVDKARSRAAGGTGLGLSIVWDTVKRWGGDITLGPGAERGTWFLVTFPLAQEEASL
ncbi:MAG: HAMP domain-containing histidine kinase [Clostridiales bacterium]|nr:HAMP domain-containing histidine kinase [Clostridiales bacterium]